MKHLTGIVIIAAVSFIGELLNHLIPLPIPGSIYGLVILFVLLLTRIVKLTQVRDVSDWLLGMMPIMFVGPVVGLYVTWDSYKSFIIPIIITGTVSTIIVLAVTGHVSQLLMKLGDRAKGGRK